MMEMTRWKKQTNNNDVGLYKPASTKALDMNIAKMDLVAPEAKILPIRVDGNGVGT